MRRIFAVTSPSICRIPRDNPSIDPSLAPHHRQPGYPGIRFPPLIGGRLSGTVWLILNYSYHILTRLLRPDPSTDCYQVRIRCTALHKHIWSPMDRLWHRSHETNRHDRSDRPALLMVISASVWAGLGRRGLLDFSAFLCFFCVPLKRSVT